MERIQGDINTALIECADPRRQTWIVRWDMKPVYEPDSGKQTGVDYYEKWVNHRITLEEVKEIVLDGMNHIIDEKILSGFQWKGMDIWLSSENQFNYKAAFDLAVQTGGSNLPVTFKFGKTNEPVYYRFESVDDLMDFYVQAMQYINNVLAEGWGSKDTVDWNGYEEILVSQNL